MFFDDQIAIKTQRNPIKQSSEDHDTQNERGIGCQCFRMPTNAFMLFYRTSHLRQCRMTVKCQ